MSTWLQGTGEAIGILPTDPARIIGQRINPSGRKALRQALLEGDWGFVTHEAVLQFEAGADVLDVNMGGKGLDEVRLLPEAVQRIARVVPAPLSIDTCVPAALEAALRVCPGRPLVNSVGCEDKLLAEHLSIIATYHVPVIGLCMGLEGIPANAEERLRAAYGVINAAVKAGIAEQDVILDPLVMTVGADDQAARVALETIQRLRAEFPNNNITGGVSNVSFGMPERTVINTHFLSVAFTLGMNIPITDPTDPQVRFALLSGDIFLGRDRKTHAYLQYYRKAKPELQPLTR